MVQALHPCEWAGRQVRRWYSALVPNSRLALAAYTAAASRGRPSVPVTTRAVSATSDAKNTYCAASHAAAP